VIPTNSSGGGVVDTILIFHAASSALKRPARRPTRGSGLGGVTCKDCRVSVGLPTLRDPVDIVDDVQLVRAITARTSGLAIEENLFQEALGRS